MKATPIAQYLEQKSRASGYDWPAARREPAAQPAPNAAVVGYEQRSAVAALVRRAQAQTAPAAEESDRFASYEEAPPPARLASVFGRRPAIAATPDIEGRLAEAYHRGVQEGIDAARAEAATARALERAEVQKRVVVERLDFQMNEYARVAELITAGLAEIEARIARSVAQILRPLVEQSLSQQVIAELSEHVSRLAAAGRPSLLRIRGPERLLSGLRARIAHLAIEVEYVEDAAAVEVSVEAHHTTIRSELAPWFAKIDAQLERD